MKDIVRRNAELDIPETEVFALFQKQRWKVMRWLDTYPDEANAVMETVVRVVTNTGTRTARYDNAR